MLVDLKRKIKDNFLSFICKPSVADFSSKTLIFLHFPSYFEAIPQPRSQGVFPGLGAGREKTLASAGHVSTFHPEILGVIN